MFRTSRAYLEHYFNRYKYNFKVQRLLEFPHRWLNYNTEEYFSFIKQHGFVNNREVFPDEIVFDIDIEIDGINKRQINEEIKDCYTKISSRLKIFNINHEIWHSGGNGCHYHIIAPQLLKYSFLERKLIKREFTKTFCKGYLKTKINKAYICDYYKPMIQLEKSKHRKGGIKKIIEENIYNLKENELPQIVIDRAIENKKNFISQEIDLSKGTPKEIALLEKEDFINLKDGRRRALFVLSAYYCYINKDDEEVLKILNDWNKYKLNGYFDIRTIRNEIKYRRKASYNRIPLNYAKMLVEDIQLLNQEETNKNNDRN